MRAVCTARCSFPDLWLGSANTAYPLFGLTPGGLAAPSDTPHPLSLNTLALHREQHAELYERLRRYRFRRNQSC